ncbi:hypothetical protein [Shewanella algae]|uniref:hypothetical protein n=1 Tax=Shewanella algae TaxID=38313 RepID=UPI0031F5C94B
MAKYRPYIYRTPFQHVLYALARNQEQYNKITGRKRDKFLDSGVDACVTHFSGKKKETLCVVQIGDVTEHSLLQVHGLLLHEAVHIWQEVRTCMGEEKPSSEFEAYSIQAIAQDLFEAFEESEKANG